MIKLEITINQKKKTDIDYISLTPVEIEILEKGKQATKDEKEISELIIKRINNNKKHEVINNSKTSLSEKLQQIIEHLN